MRSSLFVLAVVVLTPSAARPQQPEPKYDGRPLAYWVERFQKAESEEAREKAVQAVCAFGPDAAPAVPDLLVMLDDRSQGYRNQVATMLCAIGPAAKAAVPSLTKMLEKKAPRDAPNVIRVLCAIGPDATPALPAVRRLVLESFARAKQEHAASFAALEIQAALEGVSRVGAEAVPLLLDVIDTGYGAEAAARALKDVRAEEKRVPQRVRGLLAHPTAEVRLCASEYVWAAERGAAIVPVVLEVLDSSLFSDEPLASRATALLGRMGPIAQDALPALRQIAESKGPPLPPLGYAVLPLAPVPQRTYSSEYMRHAAGVAVGQISPEPKKN